MTATIYKYPLHIKDRQTLLLPAGAELLSVEEQAGVLCLWAKLDPTAFKVGRTVLVRGTGNPLTGDEGRFVGTAVMANGFVWHVFEGE